MDIQQNWANILYIYKKEKSMAEENNELNLISWLRLHPPLPYIVKG